MGRPSERIRRVARNDYIALAAFRHALRGFLHFSAEAADDVDLSPQQHQALLAIKGMPEGEALTVGELAQRLYLRHHSAVGLVDRLVKKGLIKRAASAEDRRKVHVGLTSQGEALINRLSSVHRAELRRIAPELKRWLELLHPTDR